MPYCQHNTTRSRSAASYRSNAAIDLAEVEANDFGHLELLGESFIFILVTSDVTARLGKSILTAPKDIHVAENG